MGKRKYSKSFEIALSAISCAAASIFLSLGFFSGILLATGYLFGIIALMIPLSKQFYVGGFLAYIGTCVLTILFGAIGKFWDILPFITFFGFHPLVNALQVRYKVNKWLALVLKAILFDFTIWLAYVVIFDGVFGGSFLPPTVTEFINAYALYFIFIGGTLIFILYDFFIFKCQGWVNALVARIRR